MSWCGCLTEPETNRSFPSRILLNTSRPDVFGAWCVEVCAGEAEGVEGVVAEEVDACEHPVFEATEMITSRPDKILR